MANTVEFKCPSCGAYLVYDPATQTFSCPYCGTSYNEQQLLEISEKQEKKAEEASQKPEAHLRGYHCTNCGAEIVTGETTAATRCYFCHSPVVLGDRLSGEYQPDGVIPFSFDRQEAEKRFKEYLGKRHFVDPGFVKEATTEDFSGVYFPYWYGDVKGDADFEGEGHTVSSVTSGKYVVTTTRYYRLSRKGHLSFSKMYRKALSTADRQLTEGIHPYDWSQMKPFASGFLSGFLAEKRDVEKDAALDDMQQEANGYAENMITRDSGLSGLHGEAHFRVTDRIAKYVLLPVWMMTYRRPKEEKPYYFMMNGQSGNVCGRLPLDRGKLILTAAAAGLAVAGLLCLGGAFIW